MWILLFTCNLDEHSDSQDQEDDNSRIDAENGELVAKVLKLYLESCISWCFKR